MAALFSGIEVHISVNTGMAGVSTIEGHAHTCSPESLICCMTLSALEISLAIMQFLSRTLKLLTVGRNPLLVSSTSLQEALIGTAFCFTVPGMCHQADNHPGVVMPGWLYVVQ